MAKDKTAIPSGEARPAMAAVLVDVDTIEPSPYQGRVIPKDWATKGAGKELVDSIREDGVLQAIGLRPHPAKPGWHQLVYGASRWMAAKHLGLKRIPAVVAELSDALVARRGVAENLMRVNLTTMEEAKAIAEALAACGGDTRELAVALGRTPRWVAFRANLDANLADAWRLAIAPDEEWEDLSPAVLDLIARHPKEVQEQFLGAVNPYNLQSAVRAEKALADYVKLLKHAPFDTDTPLQDGSAQIQACTACEDRSDRQRGLFDDPDADEATIKKNARCLRPDCWRKKADAAMREKFREAKAKNAAAVVLVKENYREIPEIQKALGAPAVLKDYEVKMVAASAPGAVPALCYDGAKAGKTVYVAPMSSTRSAAKTTEKPKTAKAVLAAARERLAAKRWKMLVQEVKSRFEAAPYTRVGGPAAVPEARNAIIAGLAVAYGVTGRLWDDDKLEPPELQAALTGAKKAGGYVKTKLVALRGVNLSPLAHLALWAAVRQMPFREMRFTLEKKTPEGEEFLREMARVASLDFAALEAMVATAIPPPKSLARLEAEEAKKAAKRPARGPDRKKLAAADDSAGDADEDDGEESA